MGIIIVKIYKRIISIIKIFCWKIIYGKKIKIHLSDIFYTDTHITIEKNGILKIGENCFFNHGCSINCLDNITIGNNSIFGESVKLYDHNHNYENKDILIKKQGYTCKKIKIGSNCWIGSNVIILAGVEIGNNVVIGAGSIIAKNIPDNSIVIQKKENYYI